MATFFQDAAKMGGGLWKQAEIFARANNITIVQAMKTYLGVDIAAMNEPLRTMCYREAAKRRSNWAARS